MTEIPARELRNHVSDVLRRVEAGEEMIVTVSGRPVATLTPIRRQRPRFLPATEVLSWAKADPAMLDEIREALGGETTDDLKW
jgi:prevent-host-death family protein